MTAVGRSRWAMPLCYGTACGVLLLSMGKAASHFPGGYDWRYHVISALASRKHNPDGAAWFAAGILVSMLLLWVVIEHILRSGRVSPPARAHRTAVWALRIGVVCGALVGLDRLIFFHLSDAIRKGHEILALLSFGGLFAGVIAMYVHLMKRRFVSWVPMALVVAPLIAVVLREFVLYVGQRTIGWSDHDWKAAGISIWLSFAFWQWLATAALWLSIAHLLFIMQRSTARHRVKDAH